MSTIETVNQETFVRCGHCQDCFRADVISAHLASCLKTTIVRTPFSKMTREDLSILKEFRIDGDKEEVIFKM